MRTRRLFSLLISIQKNPIIKIVTIFKEIVIRCRIYTLYIREQVKI